MVPNFNPRPLAGATVIHQIIHIVNPISIHAPLRGRHAKAKKAYDELEFQSTPPCGGDGGAVQEYVGTA